MSKSFKKNRNYDDRNDYGTHHDDLRRHRKEKRLHNAIRSRDIDDLMNLDDDY